MASLVRLGLAGVLMLAAACAGVATSVPAGPDDWRPHAVTALRTPLGGGAVLAQGVAFAGGLTLRGAPHGLSDLKVDEAGEAWAVSDFGQMVRFDLRLDRAGRLVGAADMRTRRLAGLDGLPLAQKEDADAEGLAITPGGEVLVSFERDHRIWSYGRQGAPTPVAVATPQAPLGDNEGLEGLAADRDGWLALGEAGGAWRCDRAGCAPLSGTPPTPADGYRFTGADADPAGGWFVVERFYAPPLDMRARVRRMSPEGVLSAPLIELRPPASVDNMEGIAAVATARGTRLYLLSDDNDNPLQRTLLLAFDLKR